MEFFLFAHASVCGLQMRLLNSVKGARSSNAVSAVERKKKGTFVELGVNQRENKIIGVLDEILLASQ